MNYEIVLGYAAGGIAVLFVGWLFSLRLRGLVGIALNTAAGALLLTVLSLCTPLNVPLNAFNALVVGLLGLPGAALVTVLSCFL